MANDQKRQLDAARRAKLTIQRRTLYLMAIFGVMTFVALFFKVYDLTINQNDAMKERASNQQTLSTTISASRGTIYDRNGNILAISATADTVFLDPAMIQKKAEDLDLAYAKKLVTGLKAGEKMPPTGDAYKEMIAENLARILGLKEREILEKMDKTWSQYEILAKRVEKDVGDEIRAFLTDNELGVTVTGIHLSADSKRYYPYSSMASHVLGFLDSDNQGAYGLEAIYNEELEGSSGLVITAKDATSRELMFQYEQYYDAEDGHSLQLTIDSAIQSYVERGLEEMIERYGAKNGAAGIVMDVNSGALLAIASSPSYDANFPREIYDELLQAQLTAAEEEEGAVRSDQAHSDTYWSVLGDLQLKQWRNKALNDTYEPGSTYKILTLAAALEEGKVNINSTFTCNGHVQVADWTLHCSKLIGHGLQSLALATANSCNPAFISMGLSVGTDTYYEYMKNFGLFDLTGVDLQGEAVGVAASKKNFETIDLASYSFGQNFTVTPLQMVTAQAACINGGYLYTPYVVEREVDGDGNVVYQHDATPVRQVISEETSATVRSILEFVVSEGTGRNGQVAGYRIGGKTGTADKANTKTADNPKGDVVVSFLCFAPADDPQIIMLLTMDTPSRNTGTYVSGGNMVAPTSSAVMADILPYLGIAPQYTEEELASVDSTVPYLVGMTEAQAKQKMEEYGFTAYRTVGTGALVTDQTPVGGAIVPASAELILYMGEEKSKEHCTVPDVIGLTVEKANEKLTAAGLILKTTGASGGGSLKAINQSILPGERVPAGTVISVQMGQTSTTAD